MGDMTILTAAERNLLYKADAGAIKFRMRVPLPGLGPALTFTAKNKPLQELYKIVIGRSTKLINMTAGNHDVTTFTLSNVDFQQFQEFWVTWYNKKIKMGASGERKPFLVYAINCDQEIGYLQFNTMSQNWAPVEWIVETSPVVYKTVSHKTFGDKLRWVRMQNGRLPEGAMIGGFENEPTYIARANHNNSICPGKYVPSTGLAYVPWGHREHTKTEFEILCGYNAEWVKTKQNSIPINAFMAGRSEVQNDPLYIGRAMHDGKLLTGKVHIRYKSCYLPCNGNEIEKSSYEILVIPQDNIKQAVQLII